MRRYLPTLFFLACLALPAQAQVCKKAPPPFLPALLPQEVAGMPLEFSTDPSGGCMSLYRPEGSEARLRLPWTVVTLEVNTDSNLGESADEIRSAFAAQSSSVVTMTDWPVVFRQLTKGDEYVALKGSVKITVLVKNGDHGSESAALAARFFKVLLPQIPCG